MCGCPLLNPQLEREGTALLVDDDWELGREMVVDAAEGGEGGSDAGGQAAGARDIPALGKVGMVQRGLLDGGRGGDRGSYTTWQGPA